MASVGGVESEIGWDEAAGSRARRVRVVLGRARRHRARVLRRPVDRRAGAPGQAAGCVLRVHGAVAPSVPAAQLDLAPPRRAHARRTSSATACTRTWSREQGVFHQGRRSRSPRPRRCSARRSPSAGCSRRSTDPAERLTLLAANLEDQIATVFRQIAMNRFEHSMHTTRREEGELSVERFGELWYESQHAMLGDSVEVTDGYRTLVVVHSALHRHARATCTRTPTASCSRLSVYARLRGAGEWLRAELPRHVARAAVRSRPRSSAQMVGVDLADPGVLGPRPRHHRPAPRSHDRGRERRGRLA